MGNKDDFVRTTVRMPPDLHRALTDKLRSQRYTTGKVSIDTAINTAVAEWLGSDPSIDSKVAEVIEAVCWLWSNHKTGFLQVERVTSTYSKAMKEGKKGDYIHGYIFLLTLRV